MYMLNTHGIVVPIKVNMDACMCGINFVITIELTATSTAEWLLTQPYYVVSTLLIYVHMYI